MRDERRIPGDRDRYADGGIRLSEIFSALEHRYRRYVLYVLRDEGSIDLATLAARVAAWERSQPADDGSEAATEGIRTTLYHTHLPKLDAAALIEYDSRSKVVRYRHPYSLVERLIQISEQFERPSL